MQISLKNENSNSNACKQRELLAAKAVHLSFETLRYGQFIGGLQCKSTMFIGALYSLLKLLPRIIQKDGHNMANLLIHRTKQAIQDPLGMLIDEDNWMAFDLLLVVFNTMHYFMQFTILSEKCLFSNIGGIFLEPNSETWGRYIVGKPYLRFVRTILELFVIPEEYDEFGQNTTRNVTVYKYNQTTEKYSMTGVEATFKEFADAITTECPDSEQSDERFRCAAAEQIALTQQLLLLITSTFPTVCLQEPPEEVLPVLISLLRLALARVFYVMDTSYQAEDTSSSTSMHSSCNLLQPVLSLAFRWETNTISMPLFLVPMFVGSYISHWQNALPSGSRCVLSL